MSNAPLPHTSAQSIVEIFRQVAHQSAERTAVIEPRRRPGGYAYKRWMFHELATDVQRYARGMQAMGIQCGNRIVLAVPHGYDFIALTFAVLSTGATLVLIDPGMGKARAVGCLQSIQPDGFIAVPIVQWVRALCGHRFPKARLNIAVGKHGWGLATPLRQVVQMADASPERPLPPLAADQEAAIIFTSGSTGPAKGVLFSHGNFVAQAEQIRDHYQISPGGVDLAGFPLFGLFNAAMGTTTAIPDMNAAKPASVVPARFVQNIRDLNVTQSFASPAVWSAVGRYCTRHHLKLPTLQRAFAAGAPVPARTLRWVTASLPESSEMHTPYGATEALPVASIRARDVLAETAAQTAAGKGICVGHRFHAVDWKIIQITDEPIRMLTDAKGMPMGQIGELIVRGPQVTRCYITSSADTDAHKINDGDSFWHRMGDVGYLDDRDRFWFCGRKSHRVHTRFGPLFTIPIESIFNEHPSIYRSALVGIGPLGNQQPVVICEPWPEHWPRRRRAADVLRGELHALAATNPLTASFELFQFLLKRKLPVDVRHNAKIFRERLVSWAARQIRRSPSTGDPAP